MVLAKFKGIDKNELSMIEVAHAILEQKGSIMEFNELLIAVQEYLELSETALESKMSIFYTEMNTDGSFISLGDNRWGLRSWYPIDSIDEELVSALEDTPIRRKKRKKLNAFATSDDDLDYNNDDPEDEWHETVDSDNEYDEQDDDSEDELDDYSNLSELDDDFDDETSADEDLTIVSDETLFDEV